MVRLFLKGVFSTVKHVVLKEGFTGLYQGNGVQMLRIFPYAAIQFLSYEQLKKVSLSLLYSVINAIRILSITKIIVKLFLALY